MGPVPCLVICLDLRRTWHPPIFPHSQIRKARPLCLEFLTMNCALARAPSFPLADQPNHNLARVRDEVPGVRVLGAWSLLDDVPGSCHRRQVLRSSAP